VALRGPRVEAHPGNVERPRPELEGLRGGWSPWGARRRRRREPAARSPSAPAAPSRHRRTTAAPVTTSCRGGGRCMGG
ncbi:hypothetical protein QWJ41_21490, partial [Nocardioides sp. SOB44]